MYAIFHEPQNDMVTGEKLVTGFIWRTCFKIIRSSLVMQNLKNSLKVYFSFRSISCTFSILIYNLGLFNSSS